MLREMAINFHIICFHYDQKGYYFAKTLYDGIKFNEHST